MRITLKKIAIQNFKGIKNLSIDFSNNTIIEGANATGKTSTFDAICWLLFNKDSQGTTSFAVRPMDTNGNVIDNIDISVTGTFEVDGKELVLAKTQKQNWVKHRGSETKQFEGNVNTYEVDGYPKSEKEYKKVVDDLIDEDIFKLLTNPQAFPSMNWKDQRNILMKFVTDTTDLQIAQQSNNKYTSLIYDLQRANSLEDIKAKYLKAKKELNKRMVEIPARIDELNNLKINEDINELQNRKKQIEEEIAKLDDEIKSYDDSAIEELKAQSLRLQMDINSIEQVAHDNILNSKRNIERDIREVDYNVSLVENEIKKLKDIRKNAEQSLDDSQSNLDTNKAILHAIMQSQFNANEWVFDEKSTVCKMCGQTYPISKIEKLKADFEQRKQAAYEDFERNKKAEIDSIFDTINSTIENSKKLRIKIEEQNVKILTGEENINNLLDRKNDLQSQYNAISDEIDMSGNAKYFELKMKYDEVQSKITEFGNEQININAVVEALEDSRRDFRSQLDKIIDLIKKVENNANIDVRVADLEEEQRDVSQKIADQDKMLYLLDEFIKDKMQIISTNVNKNFKNVKFNLFRQYQNGAVEPYCEVTYQGVNYANINSGHKIVAGLDIINALSKLYDTTCFSIIDNAESINDFNIPAMDCQLILLKVTEDNELRIKEA